jgi:hypothetical protein
MTGKRDYSERKPWSPEEEAILKGLYKQSGYVVAKKALANAGFERSAASVRKKLERIEKAEEQRTAYFKWSTLTISVIKRLYPDGGSRAVMAEFDRMGVKGVTASKVVAQANMLGIHRRRADKDYVEPLWKVANDALKAGKSYGKLVSEQYMAAQ